MSYTPEALPCARPRPPPLSLHVYEQVGSFIEDSPLKRSLRAAQESDDEELVLSSGALNALRALSCQDAEVADPAEMFKEIWGLSQVLCTVLCVAAKAKRFVEQSAR